MSDQGEKTCPLCAEEMDLTDQQLKPCKCGYEICVWCWHHIIDMAEKDETEGRCPACRTPYNKEKIVGMEANCERLVAEMNTEKRLKSQKAKGKTSEGRKQLGSVRVIQRNLVYIVGLPLNLADEDLLQRKEYFGQYGKVMKVSISRTAAGSIQHFANSTCSVYIAYSKEEEAVRCIQMVHGFVLEGKALRACFGTTKYCHAWLRNVPCSNPDCLYLHEIGSQEDSFTKDEIISAYTRVQQIPGVTNNMQRRSGNVLPPPADEYCNNGSASLGKPISRSATINSASITGGSPPNSSSGRSAALPSAALWGMRASNNQSPPSSLACSNGPPKQKLPDTCAGALALSTAVASPIQETIVHGDEGKKHVSNEENSASQSKGRFEQLEHGKDYRNSDRRTVSGFSVASGQPYTSVVHQHSSPASKYVDRSISKPPIANNVDLASGQPYTSVVQQLSSPASKYVDRSISKPPIANNVDLPRQSVNSCLEDDHNVATDRYIQDLCSDMSSISIKHQGLQNGDSEQSGEILTLPVVLKNTTSTNDTCFTSKQSDLRSDLQSQLAQVLVDDEQKELLSFDDQQLKDPKLNAQTDCMTNLSDSFNLPTPYGGYSSEKSEPYGSLGVNLDPHFVDNNFNNLHMSGTAILSNGYHENLVSSSPNMSHVHEFSRLLIHEDKIKHVGRFEGEVVNVDRDAGDMRESSIISNILSMDFESWDDSLTSPQNLARLLGETNTQQGSLKESSSWKAQNSSQSRFSFAREEESANRVSDFEPASNFGQAVSSHPFNQDFVDNRDVHLDKFSNCNGFSSVTADESNNFSRSYSPFHSNKLAVSRSQITAPPGFSVPNRAPPPGFSPHERMEQTFDNLTGNHMIGNSTLSRNPYQLPPSGNIDTTADIEFMDPAILAVGKGRLAAGLTSPGLDMRANFSPQLSNFENDARLRLLMQRSLSPHQNQRFSVMGDSFSPLDDACGIPSRIMEQTLTNNLSPFSQFSLPHSRNSLMSNGRWDGWNEAQRGNDFAMSELLRTERLGFNKFYNGYEEPMFRMPSPGNIYNRTFGI